ncbi:MAG: sigma-70 family RNA polymerase sigma factor, partial [Gemmataceae bacterium]|nr:sigma-70 family RNA polymerase sigma factor [Gemmataceae bacterium]
MALSQTLVRQLHKLSELDDTDSLSDGQLLECFASRRDPLAFEALMRRHGPMVFGVCRRLLHQIQDAEDAFQATFLVLVRKAKALGRREILGNWLYGVAYRTALRAKAAAAKRRAKESAVARSCRMERSLQTGDIQEVLDMELNVLPAKYRAPIVLCDLEGKTYKEAARQLGWPEGTVAGRLARARKLLAKRLTRRGVSLPAAALATLVSACASAAVPATLASATLEAARIYEVAGTTGPVAALANAVLHDLFVAKLTKVLVWLLVCTLVGLGTGLIHQYASAKNASDPPASADAHPEAGLKSKDAKVVHLGAPLWQRPLILDKHDETGEVEDKGREAKVWIERALQDRGDGPVIPGFVLLALGDQVYYRSYLDVRSVALVQFKGRFGSAQVGRFVWKCTEMDGSLVTVLSDTKLRGPLERWLKAVPPLHADALLLENAMHGAISADQRQMYCVDDFAVLPPQGTKLENLPPDSKGLYFENSIFAIELDSGKCNWRLGRGLRDEAFSESHFLGAPYPFQDKLYVLNEKNTGEVRLVVVDSVKGKENAILNLDVTPKARRFLEDWRRRLNPVRLA